MQLRDVPEKTWEISATSPRRRLQYISPKTSPRLANQPSLRCLWDAAWDASEMHLRCIYAGWVLDMKRMSSRETSYKRLLYVKRHKPTLLDVLSHLIYQVIVYQMIILLAILVFILLARCTWQIFMGIVIYYFCAFACVTTLNVHLELTPSMSAQHLISCL